MIFTEALVLFLRAIIVKQPALESAEVTLINHFFFYPVFDVSCQAPTKTVAMYRTIDSSLPGSPLLHYWPKGVRILVKSDFIDKYIPYN